nr:MAG TPA: hypothetical protein [Caudoviricetes sp.]
MLLQFHASFTPPFYLLFLCFLIQYKYNINY